MPNILQIIFLISFIQRQIYQNTYDYNNLVFTATNITAYYAH